MVSLNIYKKSANKFGRKTGFKIKNEIEDQDQSIPKLIGILTQVFCTFGPILVVLAWTGDELSCRQAQNGVTFDFEVEFDLEGQGQSPPKTIGILTKVFYTYGPNLVILAWTDDELLRGQAGGWRTRTDTHTHTEQATTIPEGQNWPRVKRTIIHSIISLGPDDVMVWRWLWSTLYTPHPPPTPPSTHPHPHPTPTKCIYIHCFPIQGSVVYHSLSSECDTIMSMTYLLQSCTKPSLKF